MAETVRCTVSLLVCPNCGKFLSAAETEAEESVVCPHCSEWFVPDRADRGFPIIKTTVRSKVEEVFAGEWITVGDCLKFLIGLPDRALTRRFPDGSQDRYPCWTFVREISQLQPELALYTPNFRCILKRMRKLDGWVCLEYGCAFEQLEKDLLRTEMAVRDSKDARRIVEILRKIESTIEIGTSRDHFARQISTHWLSIKDFTEANSSQLPLFCALVQGIYQNYRTALDLWRQGAGHLPFQFSGGGFGFRGAVTGMAIAIGLNSLVGVYNQSKDASLQDRLVAEWAMASRKIAIARKVTSAKL